MVEFVDPRITCEEVGHAASFFRRSVALCAQLSSLCVGFAQSGVTSPKPGQGGSVVKGAAGTDGTIGDNGLQHCDKPMGALAVVEPQDE